MLTAERLRELLDYDPDTGVFRWRKKTSNRAPIGAVAGNLGRSRSHYRIEIRLDSKLYKAHRLAWLYVYGRWPVDQIDHIDADSTNNRLSNLREATCRQNIYNQPRKGSNKTGFKGVHYVASRGTYRADIRINGRTTHIGAFATAEEAHEAYKSAAEKYHGEFARSA